MALTDNEGVGTTMLVQPTGYGNGGGMFGNGAYGGEWFWFILLFVLIGNNGWGNGYGGGNGTQYVANDVQRGFDQAAVTGGINGLSTGLCNGFAGVQQSLCNGFAGVNCAIANGFAQSEISANARQMADMNQNFATQTAIYQGMNGLQAQLSNCCCENRAATQDLKYTIATEACATRTANADNTTALLNAVNGGIQSIKDQLCQQEIDALKTQNQNLQTQINLANLAASQNQQTAQLLADNAAQTQYVVNRVAPYPSPAYIVANPNVGTSGCGCGVA